MTLVTDQASGTINEHVVSLRNGIRVRTLDDGSGPIVLLLHGNPDSADEYLAPIRLLKNRFRCIAPDLPGYGRRDCTYALPNDFDYSHRRQVEFLDAFLVELNIHETFTLVVHDIGGIMGVPWAAQNVNRLNAMMYTNTVVFPRHRWFNLAYRWGDNSGLGRAGANLSMQSLGWAHGWFFRRVFSRQNPQLTTGEIERFVTHFALNPIAKATTLVEFRQLIKPDFFDGYDEMLQTISKSIPTATVWGEGDPYIPNHSPQELLAKKTMVLPNVGHWVAIVAAETLAQEICALHSASSANELKS